MSMENPTGDEGQDSSQDGATAEPSAVDKLQSEVSDLKAQLAQAVSLISSRNETQSVQVKEDKLPTKEEFQKLLQENPLEAIKLATRGTASEVLEQARTQDKKALYDSKAESEFPLLKKRDPEFIRRTQEHMRDLMANDGLSKDSPTLLYRAAQLTALTYKPQGKEGTQALGPTGMSGEAPRSSAARPTANGKDPNFKVWAKVFGMDEKSQAKFLEKQTRKTDGGAR